MKFLLRVATICLVVLYSPVALGQPIPTDLKVGADFIWYIAQANKPVDVFAFKGAILPKDQAFDGQVKAAHRVLSSLRDGLIPEVDVIEQYYLMRGEQMTVFRIQSNRFGSRFFELHLLGLDRPPKIIGIKEIEASAVVQRLVHKKVLSIPQRK